MSNQQKIAEAISNLRPKLEGWCSPKKAAHLVRFVTEANSQLCVEIGVFGGASLIPQALALQAKGGGRIVGIEPFSVAEAMLSTPNGPHLDWWQKIDFAKIKAGFNAAVNKLGLQSHVDLYECTSTEAVSRFADESIDVLHIDGNHSQQQALRDVREYLPKLKRGGILFIDDISWGLERLSEATTADAIELALTHCRWIGVVDHCLICRKHGAA